MLYQIVCERTFNLIITVRPAMPGVPVAKMRAAAQVEPDARSASSLMPGVPVAMMRAAAQVEPDARSASSLMPVTQPEIGRLK